MEKYMDKSLELELSSGYDLVCGTDEAGRGPLCGPVVAAACILPRDYDLPYLNDSKKLSEKRREELYELITQTAEGRVGAASPREIDELNILNASQLAMRRAVDSLDRTPQLVLIDGNVSRGFETATKTVVGGRPTLPVDRGGVDHREGHARPPDEASCRRLPDARARFAQGLPDKGALRGAARIHSRKRRAARNL